MFGFNKHNKILKRAIELTREYPACHGWSCKDSKGRFSFVGNPDAAAFCAMGYCHRAAFELGVLGNFKADKLFRRIEARNKLNCQLGEYFDNMLGTAEDARKLFENAL